MKFIPDVGGAVGGGRHLNTLPVAPEEDVVEQLTGAPAGVGVAVARVVPRLVLLPVKAAPRADLLDGVPHAQLGLHVVGGYAWTKTQLDWIGFNTGLCGKESLKVQFTAHWTISMTDSMTVGLTPP